MCAFLGPEIINCLVFLLSSQLLCSADFCSYCLPLPFPRACVLGHSCRLEQAGFRHVNRLWVCWLINLREQNFWRLTWQGFSLYWGCLEVQMAGWQSPTYHMPKFETAPMQTASNALFGGLRRGWLFGHLMNRALYHIWQENWMIGKRLITYKFKSKELTVINYIWSLWKDTYTYRHMPLYTEQTQNIWSIKVSAIHEIPFLSSSNARRPLGELVLFLGFQETYLMPKLTLCVFGLCTSYCSLMQSCSTKRTAAVCT